MTNNFFFFLFIERPWKQAKTLDMNMVTTKEVDLLNLATHGLSLTTCGIINKVKKFVDSVEKPDSLIVLLSFSL